MVDKEEKEKLTEALKEYIGEDVGDVDYCYGEDLQESGRRITIITKPHKPTFKEKRKELVDQLEKKLKKIDGDFNVKTEGDRICIYLCAVRLYELYGEDNMAIYSVYLKVEKMAKTVEAIVDFSRELKRLKEQYKDD